MTDADTIREVLHQIVDPEIDCNIVDLGLIHSIVVDGCKVIVTMTLTTIGCPMHESIAWGVQRALLGLEGIEDVEVNVVWDPPWTPARMTNYGRERTGIG
jgi:metal-sulfur cluster biosynthetic enzyme